MKEGLIERGKKVMNKCANGLIRNASIFIERYLPKKKFVPFTEKEIEGAVSNVENRWGKKDSKRKERERVKVSDKLNFQNKMKSFLWWQCFQLHICTYLDRHRRTDTHAYILIKNGWLENNSRKAALGLGGGGGTLLRYTNFAS